MREELESHLRACPYCRSGVASISERRSALQDENVPAGLLVRQRTQVINRIESWPVRLMWWKAGAALACTSMVMLGLLTWEPQQKVEKMATVAVVSSDAQLFAEISAAAEGQEPRAGRPMHALFEENQ
jgi:predicted anti-sigma-YlaC factor YlaD